MTFQKLDQSVTIYQPQQTYPQKCMEARLGSVTVDNRLFGFLKVVDKIWINLCQLWSLHMPMSLQVMTSKYYATPHIR